MSETVNTRKIKPTKYIMNNIISEMKNETKKLNNCTIQYNDYDKPHTSYMVVIEVYDHIVNVVYDIEKNVIFVYDVTIDRDVMKCTDMNNISALFNCGIRNYIDILHNTSFEVL